MATGFCPYLLQHIAQVAKSANPMYKMRPTGYLGMLMSENSPGAIKYDQGNGHYREVRIKYKKRWRIADTDTTPSCDQVLTPSWVEDTVAVNNYRQLAIHIEDSTLAQYCSDATSTVMVGKPATEMMNEFYESEVLQGAHALVGAVNRDLINLQKSRFGANYANSLLTTAYNLNINKDSTINPLDKGITRILADFKRNQMSGRPIIVGSGLFLNYTLQQPFKSADQAGIDSKIASSLYDFYYDEDAALQWGTNHIGVFERDAVQFVPYLRNRGAFAGDKGPSTFGTIPFPMLTDRGIVPVEFDYQFKYYDCATTITNAYTGSSISVERGWSLIVSLNFGLWTIPTDAYQAGDELAGNRGSLRYNISNDCETCS